MSDGSLLRCRCNRRVAHVLALAGASVARTVFLSCGMAPCLMPIINRAKRAYRGTVYVEEVSLAEWQTRPAA